MANPEPNVEELDSMIEQAVQFKEMSEARYGNPFNLKAIKMQPFCKVGEIWKN